LRELEAGFQCEHVETVFTENRAGVKVRCEVKHHDRSQGAPKQLVAVKDGKIIRFLCLDHAPLYTKFTGRRPQQKKKPDHQAEQLGLL